MAMARRPQAHVKNRFILTEDVLYDRSIRKWAREKEQGQAHGDN